MSLSKYPELGTFTFDLKVNRHGDIQFGYIVIPTKLFKLKDEITIGIVGYNSGDKNDRAQMCPNENSTNHKQTYVNDGINWLYTISKPWTNYQNGPKLTKIDFL